MSVTLGDDHAGRLYAAKQIDANSFTCWQAVACVGGTSLAAIDANLQFDEPTEVSVLVYSLLLFVFIPRIPPSTQLLCDEGREVPAIILNCLASVQLLFLSQASSKDNK